MKLDLIINGAERKIDLLERGPQSRFRFAEDEATTAQVEIPEPGVYSILIHGRVFDARVEEAPNAIIVVIDGHRFEVEVRDPRRRGKSAAGRHADGVREIAAPMPGKVVRVLVAAGDSVQAGQGLVVVEAMKMQNELKAPRAGHVESVSAHQGATVTAGEILLRLS